MKAGRQSADTEVVCLRKATERHHIPGRKREFWRTFSATEPQRPASGGFGTLKTLDEGRLPPGQHSVTARRRRGETLTYVLEGTLSYEDSLGRSGTIRAGEFQRVSATPGVSHSALNASRSHCVHFIQLGFSAAQSAPPLGLEKKRFSTASRRGGLCAVATPDARRGSLRTEQDVLVFSALLDPGQHIVHELGRHRAVWLHIAHGEVTLGNVRLAAGDGCGVQGVCAVSLTATAQTEVLLVDLVAIQSPSEP